MTLTRPLLLLAMAAALPLLVLSAALGVSSLRQQQASIRASAEARVAFASTLIERRVADELAVLTVLAAGPAFDAGADPASASTYLTRALAQHAHWRGLVLTDAQTLRPVWPAGGVAGFLNEDERRRLVDKGAATTGHVLRSGSGRLAVPLTVPVVRDGRTRLLLTGLLDPAMFDEAFGDRTLPQEWRAGVVDQSGRILVRLHGGQDALGGFATAETLALRARAPEGFAELRALDGAPMINAYRVLPGLGWSVHAAVPVSLYRAPVDRSIWLVVGATAFAVLLTGVFIVLLLRELGLRRRAEAFAAESRRMEALGRMTGGVAHDFNNLLMIVQGSAEMLRRRRDDPEQVGKFADAIASAAQRGAALTRQLLVFARRTAQQPVDFDLQARAEDLKDLIVRSVGDRILVRIAIPASTWPVRADPEALEMALLNLALNARDAMVDGGDLVLSAANLTLSRGRAGPADLEGDFVALSVRDCGPGIEPEHLGHIFEPFYTTKPLGRGTGLGLSQVYGFARQSGGAVTVLSRPGEGATFTLYLPRAAQASAGEPSAPRRRAPSASGRLLLVEDDAEVGATLSPLLQSLGFDVSLARDADEAERILAADPGFDAVLADVMLGPGRSGAELAERLAIERPRLPVVLMTGAPAALEGRSVPVLQKPFQPDQLLEAFARARRRLGKARETGT